MSIRIPHTTNENPSNLQSTNPSHPSAPATSINLPPLRTRPVIINNTLANQWRGSAGRPLSESALVSSKQKFWIIGGLFLISAILIVTSLYFTTHHSPDASSAAGSAVDPSNPHMLKHLSSRVMSTTAAAIGTQSSASNLITPYSVIYVTVPSSEVGEKLATGLLTKKLVACANLIPTMTSLYWWQGKIQKDQEQLIMLKTRSELFSDVATFIKANHPYEVPEIIQLPIQQGSKEYLDWIGESTKGTEVKQE